MNSIALAPIGLNPLNPISGACAATTALPATFGGETFPPHIANDVDG